MYRIIIFYIESTSGLKFVDKVGYYNTRKKCTDWANRHRIRVRNNPLVEITKLS